MTDAEPILCSECGWTGERSELDEGAGNRQCPVCAEVVEFVE